MSKKVTYVFNAHAVYDEVVDVFGPVGMTPSIQYKVLIAHLIELECHVEYSESVTDWYYPNRARLVHQSMSSVRKVFHQCFNYFAFGELNYRDIHLEFLGNSVFVSNQPIDIKSLNKNHAR
jgi:hypothetical protein